MSKTYLFLISSIIFFVFSPSILADSAKQGFEIGGQLGLTGLQTNSDEFCIGMNSYLFVQTPLYKRLRLNLGGGWGQIADNEFKTCLIPIGGQLLLYLSANERWNTYLYGGGGYLDYTILDLPQQYDPDIDTQDYTWFATGGLGFTCAISDKWSCVLSGGYVQSFSDQLEGITTDTNDSYGEVLFGLKYRITGGDSDPDGDGLSNSEEKELGTDPNNPDSDGDGLRDGDEVNTYKTNPLNEDSDDDDLSDRLEIVNHKTNALKLDTDEDGLADGVEVNHFKSNPLKKDTDNDKLNDFDEVNKHRTSPVKPDTDNDGLNDFDEIETHKTSPIKADTDGDRISDSDEIQKHRTNPLAADTDNGSVDDYTEVLRGTDPLNGSDDIARERQQPQREWERKEPTQQKPEPGQWYGEVGIGEHFIEDGIYFNPSSAQILPEAQNALENVLKVLQRNPSIMVEVRGHTDELGNDKKNLILSQKRAMAVIRWFEGRGIDSARLVPFGFGEQKPASTNETPTGRKLNRRVELIRIR